ncbi:hypothetical protein GGI16_006095 [Coemansia sp. S142-1]|nr:hypothetical protein GGI16_006095 [Coemansia sp. S142-1]
MSDTVSINEESPVRPKYEYQVVSNRNLLKDKFKLTLMTAFPRTILFFHNSDINSKDEFFGQCKEYMGEIDHSDLGIVWCAYTAFASKFETEHANNELRLCIVGNYTENQYVSVKGADELETAVAEAIKSDVKTKPDHCSHGDDYNRPRCMCCSGPNDGAARIRKSNIDQIAILLNLYQPSDDE